MARYIVVNLPERQKRPGTKSAKASGCTCPIIDNHYGKGYWGDGGRYGWVVSDGCPTHGQEVRSK
jgi:hypothetical protein